MNQKTSKQKKAYRKLEDLSMEELKKKEKSYMWIMGIFFLLIIGLFSSIIRSYLNGSEMEWSILTIAICTLGGPATLYPELKVIRKELNTRKS